jgi:hypothetical protein
MPTWLLWVINPQRAVLPGATMRSRLLFLQGLIALLGRRRIFQAGLLPSAVGSDLDTRAGVGEVQGFLVEERGMP